MAEGRAGCVLIRALQPLLGIEQMQAARELPICSRPDKIHLRLLTTGPGRLAQALGITRDRDNGKDMTSAAGKCRYDLCIAEDGFRPRRVARTPRVGIRKAASSMLRYVIAGNPCVSSPRVD
jgi:DNA-3-methyladenine glycosylase